MDEIGFPQPQPKMLFADNNSMLTLAKHYSGNHKIQRHGNHKIKRHKIQLSYSKSSRRDYRHRSLIRD